MGTEVEAKGIFCLLSLFMAIETERKAANAEGRNKIILMLFFRPHEVNYYLDFIMCKEKCFSCAEWDESGSRH